LNTTIRFLDSFTVPHLRIGSQGLQQFQGCRVQPLKIVEVGGAPIASGQFADAIGGELAQTSQDTTKVLTNRYVLSSTGLDHRQNGGNPRTGSLAADVQPIAPVMQRFA
jgi:hypothetical protein